ncbi:hypothetical protein OGAPHI_001624 [Ogataea philodendri]|uniref:Uncharacterized protein n=1 Tax=Ogataea philodendri TaxID=1378263 RepID=A0A9P8PC12_9ASCO|nr:uncharacterized protein OGAPHI_001624 [Ogataea philodendri]KAH3669503.1 hypothetical protein OGAPHI_001624 [Ogataea philodendri]
MVLWFRSRLRIWRPLDSSPAVRISHFGDSSNRNTDDSSETNAMNAPEPRIDRQCVSVDQLIASSCARRIPTLMLTWFMDPSTPLSDTGDTSLMYNGTKTSAKPAPNPLTNRPNSIHKYV